MVTNCVVINLLMYVVHHHHHHHHHHLYLYTKSYHFYIVFLGIVCKNTLGNYLIIK